MKYKITTAITLFSLIIFLISCNPSQRNGQTNTGIEKSQTTGQEDIILNNNKISPSVAPITITEAGAKFYKDIHYGASKENVFDIYLPAATTPSALVIFIHGGGFIGGDKESPYKSQSETINKLLSKNIAFASLDYTLLTPDNKTGVMASLNDSKYALQFIRYYAENLHIDKNKIALMGSSAGAGTSLWIGLHDDMADKNNVDPVLRESTKVNAIIAISTQATYDITQWDSLVFQPYQKDGFNESTVVNIIGKSRVLNFYGLDEDGDINSPKLKQYAEKVNILALMSHDDPEIYVENQRKYEIPSTLGDLNHHPLHAKALMDAAIKSHVKGKFFIPAMKIDTRDGESKDDFIIRLIGK